MDEVMQVLNPALALASKWQFIDAADIVPALRAANVPYYAMVKVDEPVDRRLIVAAPEWTQLPLCRLHYLYSAGLLFAYLIEAPSLLMTVRPNLVSMVRPAVSHERQFIDSQMVLQNSHLSIFHSGDGASLVTFTDRFSNLNADILKGSGG